VELDRVARNRDAVATILVFDGAEDAPLGGRHFGSYAGAKFSVVLDSDDPNPLALEVALRQARLLALASLQPEGVADTASLLATCEQLANLIEQSRAINDGANAAERGIEKIRNAYVKLRAEALDLIEQMKLRLASDP